MRKFLRIVIGIGALLLYACTNENDASDIQVVVYPDSLAFHAETGDKILFEINATSLADPILRVQIGQKTTKTGLNIIFDSIVSVKDFSHKYQYTVPFTIYERYIELSFVVQTLIDSYFVTKYLLIDSNNTPLKESSTHVMYSQINKSNNAFSLIHRAIVSFPKDSLLSDVYEYYNSSFPVASLSYEWRSATNRKFTRFNDYNYAEATVESLQTAYSIGSKKTSISDLKINDILLVGDPSDALGVIKITAIFDEEGNVNDRYLFNLKYIE